MICLPKYGGGHRSQTPDLTPIPYLHNTLEKRFKKVQQKVPISRVVRFQKIFLLLFCFCKHKSVLSILRHTKFQLCNILNSKEARKQNFYKNKRIIHFFLIKKTSFFLSYCRFVTTNFLRRFESS